ncbi:MAG: VanW family protein [Acutalibacter sp.]|nr:VanW family protein [Acutalibacter sp.]
MKVWRKGILLMAVLLLCLLSASACSAEQKQEESSSVSSEITETPTVFSKGTTIGGKDISGKTAAEALGIARAAIEEKINAMEITVKFRDDTVSLRKDDFQVKEILELTLPKFLESGKTGELPLSYVTDLSESGRKKLQDAAKDCSVQGKNATVESYDSSTGTFKFTDEQNGSRVDMVTTLKSIQQLLSLKTGGAVQTSFLETKPELTKKYLTENFKLMSSYSTVSTNTANGNSNMALALSKVNGTILQPGQTFSYNGATGDSTDPNAGWKGANGLVGGLHVQVYGGGICQGSTTLYNAALMAGMEIVERECHSEPSTYCPIGLDATVDYGNIDFKFSNPLETPVYIASWMDGVTLYVEFYGCFPKEWDKITVGSEQTGYEPIPSGVSFREDSQLAKGQYVRRSSGHSGYTARAWRTYYKGDATVKTEELLSSHYTPGGVIYAVGPGTETGKVDTGKESGTIEADATPTPSPDPSNGPTSEPTAPPVDDPTPPPVIEPTPEPPPEPTPEPTPPPSDDDDDRFWQPDP